MTGKVLIVGALGTVGRSLIDHFEAKPQWEMVGLSRREPDFQTRAEWLPLDLRDPQAANRLAALRDVTHVVYAAVQDQADLVSGWSERDHADVNLAMLRTVIDGLEASGPTLRHVTLLQGTKAYGGHLGVFRMPARESDARYMPPNFYYDQQDFMVERQTGKAWSWTVLRPQLVCGTALGTETNIVPALGAYAAMSREYGIPLRYPGGQGRIREATDARLIAKAAEWAGESSRAANEVFNIVNGDVYMWENVWEGLAGLFNIPLGQPQPFRLSKVMPGNGAIWDRVVEKHGLAPLSYSQIVPSWQVVDWVLGYGQRPNPHHVSTIKAREFGFHDCIDTETMFIELLKELQERRVLPL